MTTLQLRAVHSLLEPDYRKGLRVLGERKTISALVYACRPSSADFQAAKNQPKVLVGPIIYPPSDPDPNGPQYEPIDPKQSILDIFG